MQLRGHVLLLLQQLQLVALAGAAAAATAQSADVAALLRFRETFDNYKTALTNWNLTVPPCNWTGVVCKEGAVVEL